MQFSRNDIIFTSVMVFLLFLLSSLLYFNFKNKSKGQSKYSSVGYVTYKNHKVLRKLASHFIWEDVESKTPIYPFDAILTRDLSDAQISLDNGLELDIDPNTMVVIDMIDGKVGMTLKEGRVKVTNKKGSAQIRLKDGSLLKIEKGSVQLNQSKGKLQIDLKKGKATLEKDGSKTKFSGGERLSVSKGNIKRSKVSIKGLSPSSKNAYLIRSETISLNLHWAASTQAESYTIYIANRPSFNNPRTYSSKQNSIRVTLPKGTWYWKVIAKTKASDEYSSIETIRILKDKSITIYSPKDQSIYYSKANNGKHQMTFSWQKDPDGAAVKFELSQSSDISKPIQSFTSVNSSVTLTNLPEGKLYFRIKKVYAQKLLSKGSAQVHTFTIKSNSDKLKALEEAKRKKDLENEKKKKEEAEKQKELERIKKNFENQKVRLIFPLQNITLRKRGGEYIRFRWRPVANANSYRVQLFYTDNQQRRQVLVNRYLSTANLNFRIPVIRNRYTLQWRVQAFLKKENLTAQTDFSKKQISVRYKADRLAAPEIITDPDEIRRLKKNRE